jgi:hypothetical protein
MADPEGRLGPLKSGTDAASRNVLQFRLDDNSRVVIRPSGTEPKNKLYIEVPGRTPPAEDLSPAELAAERERCNLRAVDLGRAFEVLMLSRVGIELPATGAALSGLVSLDNKLHFANTFLPALSERLAAGDDGLEAFIDESLARYGKDPRDLVVGGVAAWLDAGGVSEGAAARARELFGLV